MMMPANYSVIAENEMTYVVGGGLIADVLPAIMTTSNWKNVTTNLVKVVGNAFMGPVLQSTLGVMFSGYWGKDMLTMFGTTKNANGETVPSGSITDFYMGGKTVLNKIMGTIGGLAAVYTLGTGEVKMSVPALNLEH